MANGCIVTMVSAEPSPTVCVAWGGFVKDVKRRDTQDYLFCTAGGKKLSLWSLNPSNSGLVVATGGTKKLLKLYETAPGHKLLASVVGHSGAIRDLKFSPDDKQLVTVGEDGVIFVWNLYVD